MTKITAFFQPRRRTSTTSAGNNCNAATTTAKRERDDDKVATECNHDQNKCNTTATTTTTTTNTLSKRSRHNNSSGDDEDRNAAVAELLSYLNGTPTKKSADGVSDSTATSIGSSWTKALEKHFQSAAFASLAEFVATERATQTIYPVAADAWSALNVCPLESTKVVIVGQDPYHGPNQAHGLCFSVLPGQAVPPSLKNMYKELADDPDVSFPAVIPKHGHLLRWAQQGVLLLNTVLTVRKGQANSHKKKGWEEVTDEIIRAVDRQARMKGKGCVFLLWGKPATAKALQLIHRSSKKDGDDNCDSSIHTILCTSHPSPLGARKTDAPFLGSRCFSRCNKALVTMGLEPIDWNVDD